MAIRLPTHRPPTHPGEMLNEEFIKPLGLTQTDTANRLGISHVRLNEILKGKRGVTTDTALRLEKLFGMDAGFWLNLQQGWDLWHELHEGDVAGRSKIERIVVADTAAALTPALAAPRGRRAAAWLAKNAAQKREGVKGGGQTKKTLRTGTR